MAYNQRLNIMLGAVIYALSNLKHRWRETLIWENYQQANYGFDGLALKYRIQ